MRESLMMALQILDLTDVFIPARSALLQSTARFQIIADRVLV